MSGPLDSFRADFERRLANRRAMFAHLGIDVPDDGLARHMEDLRGTLLACTRCGHLGICEGWLAQGWPGVPMFCSKRDAWQRLMAAAPAAPANPRKAAE